MTDQHTPLDTRLERALSAGSLSPEQRRRHLDMIAERSRSGRFSVGRLLRDGAVAVVLIALLAGAWAMLPLGASEETDPMTVLAEMQEEISEPEPGTARYIEIDVLGIDPGTTSGLQESTVLAWERWTEDGSAERAIHNYSSDGELIGRVVALSDRTIFETPGNVEEAASRIEMHPPELFQPISAVEASEPSELFNQLEQILEEEDVNVEDEGDGEIRVWMLSPEQPSEDMLMMYEQELGIQATGWGVEHLIDTEANQRLEWRVYVEDDEGERHTLQHYRFKGWYEIDESDIPEDAFAEYTELSEQTNIVELPEQIELSLGTFDRGEPAAEYYGIARFIYVGPAGSLLELDIYEASEEPVQVVPDGNVLELGSIEIVWQPDSEPDSPRIAVWNDGEFGYRLHARNFTDQGWTEDDLLAFAEAIRDHHH